MEKLKITEGTGKLEYIRSLNTSPLNNDFCMVMAKSNTVCSKCYSIDSLRTYRKGCDKAWARNGDILTQEVYEDGDMPFLNDAIFRIHSHGELIDMTHLQNIFALARRNPQTTFSLFTKRKDLVKQLEEGAIPDNVVMVYSNAVMDRVMEEPPHGFHKTFNVVTSREVHKINCGARKCAECQVCYKFDTASVIVELEKSEQKKEAKAARKAEREAAKEVKS
jgi:hypothetical protein